MRKKSNFGKSILAWIILPCVIVSCLVMPVPVEAAGEITVAGIGVGYSAGQYFSETGKACTCHNQGICAPQKDGCVCKHVSGTAQCYAFSLWCEEKLFGTNDVKNPGAFYSLGSISKGNVTAENLKALLYGKAKPGAHIRTYNVGSPHSMTIVSIDEDGFTIAQTTTLTLTIGDSETLTATVAPTNATNKAVTWTSSNDQAATVTNGKITAVSAGTATITVTTEDGGKRADCIVMVDAPVVTPPVENMPAIVVEKVQASPGKTVDVTILLSSK